MCLFPLSRAPRLQVTCLVAPCWSPEPLWELGAAIELAAKIHMNGLWTSSLIKMHARSLYKTHVYHWIWDWLKNIQECWSFFLQVDAQSWNSYTRILCSILGAAPITSYLGWSLGQVKKSGYGSAKRTNIWLAYTHSVLCTASIGLLFTL